MEAMMDFKPMIKLRPSSASRWLACPASAWAEAAYPAEPAGEAAKLGTEIHARAAEALRAAFSGGAWTAPGDGVVDGYLKIIQTAGGGEAGRWGVEEPQSLTCSGVTISGTPDAFFLDKSKKHLTVVDLKTGQISVQAERNPQLLLYAAMILAAEKKAGGSVDRVTLIIVQPEDPAGRYLKAYDLTITELREWVRSMAFSIGEASRADAASPRRRGEHCLWCRARGTCFASALGQALTAAAQTAPIEDLAAADIDQLAALHAALKATSAMTDAVADALKARLMAGETCALATLRTSQVRSWRFKTPEEVAEALGVSVAEVSERRLQSVASVERAGIDVLAAVEMQPRFSLISKKQKI